MNILNYEESPTKKARRIEIINTARDLFIRNGIHSISMNRVAEECDISIRNLFYYYKNRDFLAVDIQIVEFSNFMDQFEEVETDGSGYDNLEFYLRQVLSLSYKNTKAIKYITAFDFYFYNGYPSDKYLNVLSEIVQHNAMGDIILKGINDGSIKDLGVSPEVLGVTLMQSLFSFIQKSIYRKKSLLEASEQKVNAIKGDPDVFLTLMLSALKK